MIHMDKQQVVAVLLTLGVVNIGIAVLLSESDVFKWFLIAGIWFLMLAMGVFRMYSDVLFNPHPSPGQREQLLADFRSLMT